MNFLCFDTEDDSKELLAAGESGFKKRITQIAAITAEGKHYYNKGDVKHFKKWLLRQHERYFYSLNIQYDIGNLFGNELDVLDVTTVGGRMIKAVWGDKIFVDVFNIWPMSVKRLGKAFGLKKLETKSMATDRAYVYRDTEIIRKAMLFAWQFCQPLGIANLPPTLGSLCVKLWQAWGGENVHDSSTLSKQALFGGRVELFKPRNLSKYVCWCDINSLYPSVMLKPFPARLESYGKKLAEYGVATVTMIQPETDLATLPFRHDNGRILYPWGKFTGTWTIAEIRAAEERGARIFKVHDCMGTDETVTPYAEFVTRLYAARLASKTEAEKLFYKLLMNNLYGRLGTEGKIGRSVWQTEKNRYDGVPYGCKVHVTYQMPLSDEVNWCHAAHVTAYGRLELLKFIEAVGVKSMIYCDTDSVIFDADKASKKSIPFYVGDALGQMKLVSWETECECYAPKMYHVGQTWKAKGVPKKLAKQFITKGHVEYDLPFKFREAIRFFDRKNRKKLSVWRKVLKQWESRYDRKKLIGGLFHPCKVIAV